MISKVPAKVFIYCNDVGENQYEFAGYFGGFIATGLTLQIVSNKAVVLKTYFRKAIKNKDGYNSALNRRVKEFLSEKNLEELLDQNFDPIDEIYL